MASASQSSQTTAVQAPLAAAVYLACCKPISTRQDGRLRVHGPTDAHCPGSGELPQPASSHSGTDLDDQRNHPSVSSTPSADLPSRFSPSSPQVKMLKRIPRGARDAASEAYAKALNSVLQDPEDRGAWSTVFSFPACCLRQPTERGGKRRNLTTGVQQQIKNYNEGNSSVQVTQNMNERRTPK